MLLRLRLSFGLIAALVLWLGFVLLPLWIPEYDWIRQTVSEIGQMGSPCRIAFAATLVLFAICLLLFAWGFRDASLKLGRSATAAYLTGFMAVSSAGVGIFAYPHPLHGVFGLSEFVSYQAPWVLALTWRRETRIRGLIPFSWAMSAFLWLAIAANLSVLDMHGWLWQLERPVYGVVQRSLFFAWCLWLAGISLMLMKSRSIPDDAAQPALSATK
jgi:hypothetical membrane protein